MITLQDDFTTDLNGSEGRYCMGECTCGKNCHNNPEYHLGHTTWNGRYPQLEGKINTDLYAYAVGAFVVAKETG